MDTMASTTASTESHLTRPAPYKIGQVLTLRRNSEQRMGDSPNLKVRITQLYQPWTLSCGMVVEILDGSAQGAACAEPMTAPTAFSKLYDWRFAHQLRDDQGVGPWDQNSGAGCTEFVSSGGIESFLRRLSADESFSLQMYHSETAAYAKLGDFQGRLAPQFLGAVVLQAAAPQGVHDRHQEHFQIRGVLLQYIQGLGLSKLDPHAPPSSWPDVVDQAVQIVRVLGDNGILNADVRPENFIVSLRSDDEKEYYQVLMIDFGQSRVRGEHEPLSECGRAKWRQDEEGAVGLVMQHRLRKLGVEICYKPSLRYLEFAEREDE
ncbi:hypothetical protein CSOJ01_07143 [Colletotrichum sojae]|uniref:Protein kinase domain-containing protein n=1 Tax=Colletotrichum sojae TaxID=2175907 RepID=A0A8H6MU21_9PEZI|nr:hypothetical protein CSOJ01_07143 [Colletotrichum sojae]